MEEEFEEFSVAEQFLNAARDNDLSALKGCLTIAQKEGSLFDVINSQDEMTGATALHMAAANGHSNMLKYLFSECTPPPVFCANKTGNTPLHWALQNGQWKAALILLEQARDEIDVLTKNDFGKSPLSEAMNYQTEKVEDTSVPLIGEVIQLILQHPTADALELTTNNVETTAPAS